MNTNRQHVDEKWIRKRIGKSGSMYEFKGFSGLAKIKYIYKKNKIIILYYNLILLLKYLKRKVR